MVGGVYAIDSNRHVCACNMLPVHSLHITLCIKLFILCVYNNNIGYNLYAQLQSNNTNDHLFLIEQYHLFIWGGACGGCGVGLAAEAGGVLLRLGDIVVVT